MTISDVLTGDWPSAEDVAQFGSEVTRHAREDVCPFCGETLEYEHLAVHVGRCSEVPQ